MDIEQQLKSHFQSEEVTKDDIEEDLERDEDFDYVLILCVLYYIE